MHLPGELLEAIVAHLGILDLVSAALVSHEWLPGASFCLNQLLQRRLSGALIVPEPTRAYFASMIGRRVIVAQFYERAKRWLSHSGILEYTTAPQMSF